MDKIAVLIPCYNESKTIAKVVREFQSALPEAVIYVYGNNSTDRSGELAKEAGAVVRREYRQGKGNVIRRMFREIDAECYLITDGDDTYPAEAAAEMVDKVLSEKADMVVGDRLSSTYTRENKRRFHIWGNYFVRRSINVLFKNDIQDIMTGYRTLSYEFVKTFPVLSKGFEIETEMSIHAADKNMHIENVVINYKDRPEGSSSKLDTYSDGIFRMDCPDFGCSGSRIFYTGHEHIHKNWPCAPLSDTDRMRFYRDRGDPVLFYRADAANDRAEEQAGL